MANSCVHQHVVKVKSEYDCVVKFMDFVRDIQMIIEIFNINTEFIKLFTMNFSPFSAYDLYLN